MIYALPFLGNSSTYHIHIFILKLILLFYFYIKEALLQKYLENRNFEPQTPFKLQYRNTTYWPNPFIESKTCSHFSNHAIGFVSALFWE